MRSAAACCSARPLSSYLRISKVHWGIGSSRTTKQQRQRTCSRTVHQGYKPGLRIARLNDVVGKDIIGVPNLGDPREALDARVTHCAWEDRMASDVRKLMDSSYQWRHGHPVNSRNMHGWVHEHAWEMQSLRDCYLDVHERSRNDEQYAARERERLRRLLEAPRTQPWAEDRMTEASIQALNWHLDQEACTIAPHHLPPKLLPFGGGGGGRLPMSSPGRIMPSRWTTNVIRPTG